MKKQNQKKEESPQQLRLFVGKEDADMRIREPKDGAVRKRKNTTKENAELQEELRTERKRTAAKQNELDEEREKHDDTQKKLDQVEKDNAITKQKLDKTERDLEEVRREKNTITKKFHEMKEAKESADKRNAYLEDQFSQVREIVNKGAHQAIEETKPEENDSVCFACFSSSDADTIKMIETIIKRYYQHSPAKLALIEVAFYDHSLLHHQNQHKLFVDTLIEMGLIPKMNMRKLKNLLNGMSQKSNRLPKGGYKTWTRLFASDKAFCERIGAYLGDKHPYNG